MSEPNHPRRRMFRHLPPTAVPVAGNDVWRGLASLVQPQDAREGLRSALVEQTHSPNCHLLGSAREALAVILLGLKRLSNRSQVIIPAYSCPTVVQSVLKAGMEPVMCDMSIQTLDLDRAALSNLISEKVLAIVATHLYGLAQDVRDLLAMGQDYGTFVVEDAAQAFGATFQGRKVGTWGDAGLYSLGRSKCIPAGHGGVIVSQNHCAPAISEAVQESVSERAGRDWGSLVLFVGYGLATHPAGWWLVVRTPLNPADEGMDVNTLPPIHLHEISPVHAGIGVSILERLESLQATSRRNARRLMAYLAESGFVTLPQIPTDAEPVFLRLPFVVEGEERVNRVFDQLWKEGIGVSRSYWRTLPDLFSDMLSINKQAYPAASQLASCLLTLPTHAYLKEQDFERIASAFRAVDSQGG
jgi:perosamine synthetase